MKQIDIDGTFSYSSIISSVGNAPDEFMLSENYPNPFNPETNIKFTVPQKQQVSVKVYNSIGMEVTTLFNGLAEANRTYNLKFNGSNYASGVYFSRFSSENYSSVKKMILMK